MQDRSSRPQAVGGSVGLLMPATITFDKWGGLWVLANHLVEPVAGRLP